MNVALSIKTKRLASTFKKGKWGSPAACWGVLFPSCLKHLQNARARPRARRGSLPCSHRHENSPSTYHVHDAQTGSGSLLCNTGLHLFVLRASLRLPVFGDKTAQVGRTAEGTPTQAQANESRSERLFSYVSLLGLRKERFQRPGGALLESSCHGTAQISVQLGEQLISLATQKLFRSKVGYVNPVPTGCETPKDRNGKM